MNRRNAPFGGLALIDLSIISRSIITYSHHPQKLSTIIFRLFWKFFQLEIEARRGAFCASDRFRLCKTRRAINRIPCIVKKAISTIIVFVAGQQGDVVPYGSAAERQARIGRAKYDHKIQKWRSYSQKWDQLWVTMYSSPSSLNLWPFFNSLKSNSPVIGFQISVTPVGK